MRIIHVSDLHLGRQFNGIPLDTDHDSILDQIARAVVDNSIDVLVIAGDIFDRASPPATAVRQFNSFLDRISYETALAVVMIAGNHDSPDRIASMSIMTDKSRALIRGAVSADEKPLLLADEHGVVAFSGLPFSYEYAARECFEDKTMQTPEDVLSAQVACARANVPDNARWVVIAHAFVSGAASSDSERSLTRVGGIETVRPEIFDGAHYVALGHLHRAQTVGAAHIWYSGSPLAFSFDEGGVQKSMCVIDLDGAGTATVETIPFIPFRGVRSLRGKHAELLLNESSTDFVKAVLTDDAPVIDGMKRLRGVFPNACELIYERDERAPDIKSFDARRTKAADPIDVIGGFLEAVRAERMSDAELSVVATALQDIRQGDDAA